MRKSGRKSRDIRFRSEKNNAVMLVHSQEARSFARLLESDDTVSTYVTGKPLDPERLQMVQRVEIRGEYFQQQWETDFYILYADGSVAIREIASQSDLTKPAEIEKLELSRRFWKICGVQDWKIVLTGGAVCS